jgi:hypothetical protein
MRKVSTPAHPIIVHAKDVSPEPIEWIWERYIPKGMVVMLDGDPGLGKSTLMLQISTQLSRNWPFLDQLGKATLYADIEGPQHTLILSAEDSLPHIMIPRLQQAGADMGYIHFMNEWVDTRGVIRLFDLDQLPMLIEAIEELRPVLVVLDPLVAYLGRIDMHRSNETRSVMTKLRGVAETYQCTIIGIRHPSKLDQGGPLMYRGQGNMDIVGAARSALWVQKHPTHPETQSLMIQSKSNVGMPGRSVIFSREHGEFRWKSVTRLTESMFTGKGPDPYTFLDCFFWLEEYLTPGKVYLVDEINKEAENKQFSHKILMRAKKALGIHEWQEKGAADKDKHRLLLPPLTHTPHTHHHTTGSTGSTGTTGSTGSTGYSAHESNTYDTSNGHHPENPVTPVDAVHPVDPVLLGEPYICCETVLADNQKYCMRCGEPRKAATR